MGGISKTSKGGDRLSQHEASIISKHNACPDCGGRLAEGPTGGLSVNIRCIERSCQSEFNASSSIERISDRSPGGGP